MAYISNPVTWVGVAIRTADGKLTTYEIDSRYLTTVEITTSVDVADVTMPWDTFRREVPGEYEHVDIRISGSASRWRDYPDGDREAIEPTAKAIEEARAA